MGTDRRCGHYLQDWAGALKEKFLPSPRTQICTGRTCWNPAVQVLMGRCLTVGTLLKDNPRWVPRISVGFGVLYTTLIPEARSWEQPPALKSLVLQEPAHQRKQALEKLPVLREASSTGEALHPAGVQLWIRHPLCGRLVLGKHCKFQESTVEQVCTVEAQSQMQCRSWALEEHVC